MIANHRKKFWERTIAILSSSCLPRWLWRKGRRRHPPRLPPSAADHCPPAATTLLLPSPALPAEGRRLNVKNFINLGAHIMSPTILKLLLTAMTLVSVASEEGKTVFSTYFEISELKQ